MPLRRIRKQLLETLDSLATNSVLDADRLDILVAELKGVKSMLGSVISQRGDQTATEMFENLKQQIQHIEDDVEAGAEVSQARTRLLVVTSIGVVERLHKQR